MKQPSRMPYHRRFHEDALRGFSMLTLEQRGAYQTILDLIYTSGGDIADNERWLAGQMMISVRRYRTLRDELVAHGKIWIVDGKIGNSRASTELENQNRIVQKIIEGGQKGGLTRAENARKSSENALKTSRKRVEKSSKNFRESAEPEQKTSEIKGDAQASLEAPLKKTVKHPDPDPEPDRIKPSTPSSTSADRPSRRRAAGPPDVAGNRAPPPSLDPEARERLERSRRETMDRLRSFAEAEEAEDGYRLPQASA